MLKRTVGNCALLAVWLLFPPLLQVGCEKEKTGASNTSSAATASTGSSTTAPASIPPATMSSGGADSSAKPGGYTVPKIGVPPVTAAAYKPVLGKRGGNIVLAALGEPKSFNPITAAETSTTVFTGHMFQGLTDMDAFTGDMKPLLAEKWEVASDGLTWTFHLRHDVTFNDGSPFTAKDVVFTYDDLVYDLHRPEGKTPRWPCSARDALTFDGKIIKVEAVDDYTVRMTTPIKIAIMDELAAQPILSAAKYGPMVTDGSFGGALGTDSKPEDLVGTGPFVVSNYRRGERVVLSRSSHFWRKDSAGQQLPYLDALEYRLLPDTNSWLLNFNQKVVDEYSLRSGADVAALRLKQKDDNFTLYQLGPTPSTLFLTFNMNEDAAAQGRIADYKVKWFRDRRFRQAVSYAIDRNALVRNVLRNLGYPMAAPYTRAAGPFKQEGFEPIAHDPEKARALLAEMGFKDRDNSGVLSDAEGHPLSFTLNSNKENDVRVDMCDFVRKDLEAVGMKVNTLMLQFNLLAQKLDNSYDWDCMIMGLTGGEEPYWGANVWKSDGRVHMWWPKEKQPSFPWEGSIDKIFLNSIQELDKPKRKQMFRQWVQIVYDEQPFIYLTCSEQVIAVRNRFGNFFPPPIPSASLLHNEDEIFVKDASVSASAN